MTSKLGALLIGFTAFTLCGLPAQLMACQPISPAPAYLACHASLGLKNVPVCPETTTNTMQWAGILTCKPRECLLRTYDVADCGNYIKKKWPDNNPPCDTDARAKVEADIAKLLSGATENPALAKAIAGNISAQVTTEGSKLFNKNEGFGDFGKIFEDHVNQNATCMPMAAVVPAKATVTRWVLFAADAEQNANNGAGACYENPINCRALDWSLFEGARLTQKSPSGPTVLSVVFKHWRNDMQRRAGIAIWFTPPKGFSKPVFIAK